MPAPAHAPAPAPAPAPAAPVGPDKPKPPTGAGGSGGSGGSGGAFRAGTSSPSEAERAFAYSEDPDAPDFGIGQPGWTAQYFDLAEPEPGPDPEPEPEPEADPEAEPSAPEPGRPRPGLGRLLLGALFGRPPAPPEAPPAPAVAAVAAGAAGARKPAPLLLLGAGLLLAGAVTGQLLVMLLGWAAAYLSKGWTDLMKKFAVLGIPLITVTGLTVWNWGREKGRWGSALAPGSDAGATTWAAAPTVLRAAAVLSALFVLAVTLRRRKG
ncbi:hypothetical protein K353_03764 [Kitasatospora sp. SolWspMP-SS2h]|uniref:hypothetical protein n=1 Tax=Kitasatospora sp. SolWspMP-SS2h TaxID=1305729 RepID=UPI000DBFE340|nr:hypothetical protein [Kitasatospora sp. SolWspMP-SS2h]RAJ39734.1 hypothetical protein K353_03764 [Kitasatospora sp. SolWspMP-SS2h]